MWLVGRLAGSLESNQDFIKEPEPLRSAHHCPELALTFPKPTTTTSSVRTTNRGRERNGLAL